MLDYRSARVVVLCEDRTHYHFIRGFLLAKGCSAAKITPRQAPPGIGSAENYVREHFPAELRAHRSRSGNVLLIVCMDQDKSSTNRHLELVNACEAENVPPPDRYDRMMTVFPSRNIETWLYCLHNEQTIDESINYKQRLSRSKPGKLGSKLAQVCRNPRNFDFPSSLETAKQRWREVLEN